MPKFGDYETIDEPIRVTETAWHISTIWKARQAVAQDGVVYVVKQFTVRSPVDDGIDPLHPGRTNEDRLRDFLEGVQQIAEARSQGGSSLAPIHAFQTLEDGAWYATDFYPRRTLKEFINLQGGVDGRVLERVIYRIVSGCLALQRASGRSHGNLKASNILLAGKPQHLRKTPLHLVDALPVRWSSLHGFGGTATDEGPEQTKARTEEADIRCLGELILQLVEGRVINNAYDYNYPVAPSPSWDNLREDASLWRQRCNQLLNPQLKLNQLNLQTLENEFRPARFQARAGVVVAGCVGTALLAAGTWYANEKLNRKSSPPTAVQLQLSSREDWKRLIAAGQEAGARGNWRVARDMLGQALHKAQQLNDAELRQQTERELTFAQSMSDVVDALREGKPETARTIIDKIFQQRPKDAAAAALRTQIDAAVEEASKEREFQQLIQASQRAEADEQWSRAVELLKQALLRASTLKDPKYRAPTSHELEYAQKMDLAQKFFDDKVHPQFLLAIAHARDALALKSSSTNAAARLIERAQQRMRGELTTVSVAPERTLPIQSTQSSTPTTTTQTNPNPNPNPGKTVSDESFLAAMKAAEAAFKEQNYAEALKQAEAALALKSNDPSAGRLRADAQLGQRYQAALGASKAALNRGDFSEALRQADAALVLRRGDPQAAKLKVDAAAERDYQTAWKAAEAAFSQGGFAEAIKQADLALASKSGDAPASRLKAEAQAELSYLAAMNAAQAAIDRADYDETIKQAEVALTIRPKDGQAARLKAEAQAEQTYLTAMRAAQAAFNQAAYAEAIKQADIALSIKSRDAQAAKLKADSQSEQAYQSSLRSAQTAFDRGDYAQAIREAQAALNRKKSAPEPTALIERARVQVAKGENEQQRQEKYAEGMKAGRAALERREYGQAIAQAETALAMRPGDAEAGKLKQLAQQEQAYAGATAAFNQGDYAKALSQCQEFAGTERFDRLSQQIGQEQNQLRSVQQALGEGTYAAILGNVLPGKAAFEQAKTAAAEENRALQQATQKLAGGDYGFIEGLEQQSYKAKPPFASLLDTGRKEREIFKNLQRLKAGDQRQVLIAELAKLPQNLRAKSWFADLAPAAEPNPELSFSLAKNDRLLAYWEVYFGLKPRPADSDIRPVRDPTKDSAYNLKQFDKLESDYVSGGSLDADRKHRINALRWRVSGGGLGEAP